MSPRFARRSNWDGAGIPTGADSRVSRVGSIQGDNDSDSDGDLSQNSYNDSIKQAARSQDRKNARKIKRLLRLSLEGWSMDAHKVWSMRGRRAVDCWLDGRFEEEGRSFIPIEVRMHILGFLCRDHWVNGEKLEGEKETGEWLDQMKAREEREHEREEEKGIEDVEREEREETEGNTGGHPVVESLMVGIKL